MDLPFTGNAAVAVTTTGDLQMKPLRTFFAAGLGLVTALTFGACLSLGPTSPDPGDDGRGEGGEDTTFQVPASYMA